MEPLKMEQGNVVLKQVSREKACWLTQEELENKPPAHGRRNFLDQKREKSSATEGLN